MQLYDILLAVAVLAIVGLIVLSGQFLYQRRYMRGEYARKFIHMALAAWVATWRIFLSQSMVVGLAIFMAVIVVILKRFKLFKAMPAVRRTTYGELSYAVAIGLTAAFFQAPELYALAIINLGFADGLAAVIGTRYGKKKRKVFGATKTNAGFYAAFLFTILSGSVFWQFAVAGDQASIFIATHVFIVAGLVATVELLGQRGIDNILIPMVTGLAFLGLVA